MDDKCKYCNIQPIPIPNPPPKPKPGPKPNPINPDPILPPLPVPDYICKSQPIFPSCCNYVFNRIQSYSNLLHIFEFGNIDNT